MRGRMLQLEHFLNQRDFDIRLLSETFFNPGLVLRLASYVCQNNSGVRFSHPVPPWCFPPLCVRSGPEPLEDYCHSSHIGRQTG